MGGGWPASSAEEGDVEDEVGAAWDFEPLEAPLSFFLRARGVALKARLVGSRKVLRV